MSFQDLQIDQWLKDAVHARGFTKMTPVQTNTIPLFLRNKDVVVEAVTGSGKTLAYLLPAIDKILKRESDEHGLGALIVAPTRELANQIFHVTEELLVYQPEELADQKKLVPDMYIGGKGTLSNDLTSFRKKNPTIVIGTPGRLNEMLGQISSKNLAILILDEADTLIDMGFQKALQSIIAQLPKQRRTGLFSATMNDTVSSFLKVAGLRNSVRVSVTVTLKKEDTRAPSSLSIQSYVLPPMFKTQGMLHMLQNQQYDKAIVFFLSCATVEYFYSLLSQMKLPFEVIALHGKQAQSNRSKNYEKYVKSNKKCVLLTTDVASRGLDIPNVDLVLQLDPPLDPKSFSHRCGRAGRAGRSGLALVFLNEGREEDYEELLRVRKVPIKRMDTPEALLDRKHLDELTKNLRSIVTKDRDIYEKGLRGFVSHVRAYTKHQASFIFRIKDMDLHQLATAYSLLHLPKMPELKDAPTANDVFQPVDIDTRAIAFLDSSREQARQRKLEEQKSQPEKPKLERKPKAEAWSKQKEMKEKRLVRREKRKSRREFDKTQKRVKMEEEQQGTRENSSSDKVKHGQEDDVSDEENLSELEDDYRALQKEKKKRGSTSIAFDGL
ncbi:ATP-dependent RNA helicase Spb4 [Schizosaccharomyces cryophilus OY26]|uniref:RNA helicase n=1 Tax=Schizosaccharomyces cryophilus (strain OY26 / ATCC MYA-4695 / CBS 11777 / NBRC 106824 / NRRL Y48691) TaxID=653667 RepID=S9XGV5_SCHCR|nr:ATP-dependent RNA helicase Spb4 [Schizosaccharomyces cryophilus OY26]EPY52891.1 ATP-dependent RNA helicase Spb4 [Schizosaccharomyces cryophilus OY26]